MESGLLLVRSMAVHIALWILAPPSGLSSIYMLAACRSDPLVNTAVHHRQAPSCLILQTACC